MALQLYANPYDTSAKGFYFSSFKDYEKKAKKSRAEEFEIEFIDGDDIEQKLFDAMGVNQSNIEEYFDAVDEFDDEAIQKISILTEDIGYSFDDALDKMDDLIVYGEYDSDEDFAMEYVDSIGSIGDALGSNAESYFDFEAFGRDLRIDGYDQAWIVEWETSDDKGELDEEFREYDEAEDAGKAWEAEAEDDGEENASYEVVEKESNLSDQEIGEDYVDNIGGVDELDKQTQETYFDWAKFARDLMMDMGRDGKVYYDATGV